MVLALDANGATQQTGHEQPLADATGKEHLLKVTEVEAADGFVGTKEHSLERDANIARV